MLLPIIHVYELEAGEEICRSGLGQVEEFRLHEVSDGRAWMLIDRPTRRGDRVDDVWDVEPLLLRDACGVSISVSIITSCCRKEARKRLVIALLSRSRALPGFYGLTYLQLSSIIRVVTISKLFPDERNGRCHSSAEHWYTIPSTVEAPSCLADSSRILLSTFQGFGHILLRTSSSQSSTTALLITILFLLPANSSAATTCL